MKVVIVSDIHANLPALHAVLPVIESIAPDAVVIGGDVVNRGAQPAEVLDIVIDKIEHHGWHILKGNHEDYVGIAARGVSHLPSWEQEVYAHTLWTAGVIPDYLPIISAWPDSVELNAPDGSRLSCFHASRKGNRIGLYTTMADDELIELTCDVSSAICVGHTHVPFVRRVRGTLVVNAGAVGMPFDGIPDASMALVEWTPAGWNAEIVRVPYDRGRTLQAFYDTGYITDGGRMVQMIVRELQESRPMLGMWHRHFEADVASGRLDLQESIDRMMAGSY